MKAISPLIAMIFLILIVIVITTTMGPWIYRIVIHQANQTETDVDLGITCQQVGYDFDTSWGTSGLEWDFSGANDYLKAKIKNHGTINLYGFSFEIELGSIVKALSITEDSQKNQNNPLRPGQSAILEANITEDLTGTLTKLTVLNDLGCDPISQEV